MRRHIAALFLLAVFLPMLTLSSLHIHETVQTADTEECTVCADHKCAGHVTQLPMQMHQCVLCQFLSLVSTPATVLLVIVPASIIIAQSYRNQRFVSSDACRIKSTRAPPFVL